MNPRRKLGLAADISMPKGSQFVCMLSAKSEANCTGPRGTYVGMTLEKPMSGVRKLAAGGEHACVLREDASVWCWGYNAHGNVGPQAPEIAKQAVRVPGVAAAHDIGLGYWHSCAILAGGTVSCWGRNAYGQLGDGRSTRQPQKPRPVRGLRGVEAITGGLEFTCARMGDGTVMCWGDNRFGQLGDGTRTWHALPRPVPGLGQVKRIAAGQLHTCALLESGQVMCWGQRHGDRKTLGDPAPVSTRPTAVTGLQTVRSIAAGTGYTCALQTNGHVACWGWNGHGQLGDGTKLPRSDPYQAL